MSAAPIKNLVTEITGTDYPIIQAPMSWIASAQLASALCNAGAMATSTCSTAPSGGPQVRSDHAAKSCW